MSYLPPSPSAPLFPTVAGHAGELTTDGADYALESAETSVQNLRFNDALSIVGAAIQRAEFDRAEVDLIALRNARGAIRHHAKAHRAWQLGEAA